MQIDFSEIQGYKDEGLRDYQQENKTRIYELWKSCQSVMLQMPTGTGKTRLFVSIVNDLRKYDEDVKVLIVAHRDELIEQIRDELANYGLSCGLIIPATSKYIKYSLAVASIQTLNNRLCRYDNDDYDFVIIDEAHHATAKTYLRVLNSFYDAKVLGVTATPYRMGKEGFADIFDKLIVSPGLKDFIQAGYLSGYKYYSYKKDSYLQSVIDGITWFDKYGDYDIRALENALDNRRIQTDIIKMYFDYAYGKKGIVYAINRTHAYNLCKRFLERGIRAKYIDSGTPKEERKQIVSQFRAGIIDVLCNVNIFTEGFDCPDVEFILLARPTCSMGLYLQQVGRGLRSVENKSEVIFLDAAGLYNSFGFPTCKIDWAKHFLGSEVNNGDVEEFRQECEDNVFKFEQDEITEGEEEVFLLDSEGELSETTKNDEIDRTEIWNNIDLIIQQIIENNKIVIESIFGDNETYYKKGFNLRAVTCEDIFDPLSGIDHEMDEESEEIKNHLKYDLKPVLKEIKKYGPRGGAYFTHRIAYRKYRDSQELIDDLISKISHEYSQKLMEINGHLYSDLDKFDIFDLLTYFEHYHGTDNETYKKLLNISLYIDFTKSAFKDFKDELLYDICPKN